VSEWSWVAFAYIVAYGSIALFGASIAARIARTRQTIERTK